MAIADTTENASDAAVEGRLVDWIERTQTGTVTELTRQNRWRPAWFAELTQPKAARKLYVRGDRTSKSVMYPLEYEYHILQVLEANGIPVPHVYGLCPDPLSIVMAQVPGRADLSTAETEDERGSVLDHYIDILADIHRIDVDKFEAIGLKRPREPEAIALNLFEEFVNLYRAGKRRPSPALEYMIRWVRRNAPQHRRNAALVVGDPGQFMFDKGRVTAVVDLELAYIGDPLHDLAGLQLRNTSEPLGDLGRALRRYMANTGENIDEDVFDFHFIQFAVSTPLSMEDSVTAPLPLGALVQYMDWYVQYSRMPLELMARRTGVALPPLKLPEFKPSRFGTMGEGLIGAIRAIPVADSYGAYSRDSSADLARYLHRVSEMGPAFEQQDIAETEALLGASFDHWQDADAALESFVERAGPEYDAALIPLFYRRMQRQEVLLDTMLPRTAAGTPAKSFAQLVGRA